VRITAELQANKTTSSAAAASASPQRSVLQHCVGCDVTQLKNTTGIEPKSDATPPQHYTTALFQFSSSASAPCCLYS
jgi:hypothetical protein